MSKTSAINLVRTAAITYWKRCVVLVTAFATRYREDPFLRTEAAIVFLQITFALILLGVVWAGFNSVHQDVTNALIAHLIDAAQKGKTALGSGAAADILHNVQEVQAKSLVAIVTSIILTTALFGYALARLALIPTRNALNSQKQFIGNIAHELRTPLSIIKTNAEVTLFDQTLDPSVRKVMESNIEELDRISQIINNLLSLSAFVRPERIEFTNVDMGSVIHAVISDVSPLIKQKNQTLSIKKGDFAVVWGNRSALEQIAMNLLKNSINYTNPGGEIQVSVQPDYVGSILLTIRDTGLGIARKDLFRVFEPFYRAEESRSRQRGFSGLGLAIVSELVKLHRGKITIQSAVGRGTTVVVTLPCGKTDEDMPKKHRNTTKEESGEIAIDFSTSRR
ncbi:MAG: HAMP domain-containing histidine kinase [Patescibacteria group bacterium]|nr:HAMP domain-containing histidine kinase [Patescibacteria group bacterium]